jgi:hypothetical protein
MTFKDSLELLKCTYEDIDSKVAVQTLSVLNEASEVDDQPKASSQVESFFAQIDS